MTRTALLACVRPLLALVFTASIGFAAERQPWLTSRVKGSPQPPLPYRVEQAFGDAKFDRPVVFTNAPGTDSMFVLELPGRIFELRPDAEPILIAELSEHVEDFGSAYGLEFHPRFRQNREIFVCYIKAGGVSETGTVVSRFRLTDTTPMRIEPNSEEPLYTWLSGGHNGGCVKFGPDGYLYVSAGDAAAPFPPDPLKAGQDLSNLLSTIVRIDVDQPSADRPYSIPANNPFVELEGARPEIWCYGFRNPWRMAFDRKTGDLWVGDVGWELWEMIYCVESGGNYGWSIVEGPHSLHPGWRIGPTPISSPAASHSHTEARSITGGQVYYGSKFPELRGSYIYGDHVTGRIWSMRKTNDGFTEPTLIARAPLQIICFGLHNDGELYIVDYAGTIHELSRNESVATNLQFPRTLSESGLFSSVVEHELEAGVVAYSVIAEPWMDDATGQRFIGIPRDGRIGVYREGGGHNVWNGRHKGSWKYPKDSVLGKTISLRGRRVETQLLHYDGEAWQPYSYVWNADQTDARLADDVAQTIEFDIEGTPYSWQVSNRTECMVCHSSAAGMIIGFKPNQLRRSVGDVPDQLAALEQIGLFEETPPADQTLVGPHDDAQPLEDRVKAYLHVNCSHCHRREGGGAVAMDVVFGKPLEALFGTSPSQGDFGIRNARVVAPGDPFRSVLYYRLAKLGPGRMPRLGGAEVDPLGTQLFHDWIVSLGPSGPEQSGPSKDAARRASTRDGDELFELLSDTSQALAVSHAIGCGRLESTDVERILAMSRKLPDSSRDLFERFVPRAQRTQRLGSNFDLKLVLSAQGSSARGRRLFQSDSLACKTCHAVAPNVVSVGPNLTSLSAASYAADALLKSIVTPSEKMDEAFRTHLVQTSDGRVLSGVLRRTRNGMIVLRDAENKEYKIDASDVEFQKRLEVSLMPERLLENLTRQQAADLLAYIASLAPSDHGSGR